MQNPALQPFEVFVGNWEVEVSGASFLPDPAATLRGHVAFEWAEDGAFLVMRALNQQPGAPDSTGLISRDETTGRAKMLYFDSRGVSRIYDFSLEGGVWKMWRAAPGFSQRFEGRFSDADQTIRAAWEKSFDGATWEHDFDLRYTKTPGA